MKISTMFHSRTFRTVLKVLLVLVVLGAVIFRVRFASVEAVAHPVGTGEIAAEVMGTGTLEARVKMTVSPKIQGRLTEVPVNQGDRVKKGALLARLDDSELRQQVEIAEATLKATRGSVERVRADEARAQAVEKRANQEHDRMAALVTQRSVSQADFDTSVANLQVAEAELQRVAAAIDEAELQVVTAEKTLLYQQELLRNTEIVSPMDGLIVRRDRDPGDVVVPGASILQLVSTEEMWISAWVDETAMAGLAADQPARVVFRSMPDKGFPGSVARLGREADRETREFVVDVHVKELPANWAVGQRAEVFIETGRKSGVVVIPEDELVWQAAQPGAFVETDGKSSWRPVTLGMRGGGRVEISSGLSTGDRVLTAADPKKPLADGKRVSAP